MIALTETDFDSNEVVCHKEGAIKEFLWFEANLLVDKELGNLLYKGQLISKCFLVPSLSSKKMNKNTSTSRKVEFVRSFFGRIEDTKKYFLN